MKVVIVDDEMPAREELKFLLSDYDRVNVLGEAADGESAVNLIYDLKPDVVFLDIQMPAVTGIEVAEILLNSPDTPYIIFITAYDSYAIKAFELHAVDYLLKPIEKQRLTASIKRVEELVDSRGTDEKTLTGLKEMIGNFKRKSENRYITVCRDERFYPIPFEQIKYAYSEGKKTVLVTTEGKFSYKNTLQSLEEAMTEDFIRTHKSYIVNIRYIEEIEPWFNGAYQIKVREDDHEIPLSRSYARNFKDTLRMS